MRLTLRGAPSIRPSISTSSPSNLRSGHWHDLSPEPRSPVFLSVSSAPILDREGRIIAAVVTFLDLTHRKGTEEVLRSTEKLAATGRLAASFGHEINNPLQTLGSLLYLLGQSTNLGEAECRHLTRARAELEHMAHLTTSLLGFYRSSPSPAEV